MKKLNLQRFVKIIALPYSLNITQCSVANLEFCIARSYWVNFLVDTLIVGIRTRAVNNKIDTHIFS